MESESYCWLVIRKSILTKDNLLKKGWKGKKGVLSMDKMKVLIIYFLSAMLLGSFGAC